MKERLLNNLSLKIVSVIAAIVLWVVIVNIYDPSTSVTVSGVTVKLINTESLTDKEYSYEVVDGNKISVYLSGPRSIITDINANDIEATADLSNVTVFSDYVDINVKIIKENVKESSVEVAPKTSAIKLKIENRISKNLIIDSNIIGVPMEGFITGNIQISPGTVKVTGTTTLIESVASARVNYDISGATMTITDSAPIILLDNEGNEIKDDRLELSKSIADIKVSISPEKTVPLEFKTKGTVADGYIVGEIISSMNSIEITGTKEVLDTVEKITIPDSELDVEGLSADKIFNINISQYLPANVWIASNSTVTVDVKIEKVVTKNISIPTSQIVTNNMPADLILSSYEGDLNIVISGNGKLLNNINANNITVTADFKNAKEGSNNIPLTVKVSDTNVKVNDSYTINANLSKKEAANVVTTTTDATVAVTQSSNN